ncbi:MAG: class I SAM-dependent methyltransferase [Methylococcaceae bacterium]|nr:class I SAM-dependent methyltransferase [Methylococcaceae bacterium]
MSAFSQLLKYIQLPKSINDLSQAQRLFHGRGHAYKNLEHITIDWLPPVILITLFSPEPRIEIEYFADWLLLNFPFCQSIQLQHRYKLSGSFELIRGDTIQNLSIQQDDLKFNIHLGQTRNTGLFLDMQNGRRWIQKHSKGKRVLNLFAYTCGFSVVAQAGMAKSILNVDMSRTSLNIGRENHRLNQQSLDQVKFEKLNIFKSFSRFKKRGPFDLLICDPPTFQKGSVDIARDYPKIIRRLDEFMEIKSTLLLCLNSPELGRDFLMQQMAELAPRYMLINEINPPEIYVEAEGKGLTALCFQA